MFTQIHIIFIARCRAKLDDSYVLCIVVANKQVGNLRMNERNAVAYLMVGAVGSTAIAGVAKIW